MTVPVTEMSSRARDVFRLANPHEAAATFTIGTTTIHTSAATTFDDVTCATLANTNLVEVKGRFLSASGTQDV